MHLHFKNKSNIHTVIISTSALLTDFETDFKIRPFNIKVIQVHSTYSGVAQFVKAEFQVWPRWSFALSI